MERFLRKEAESGEITEEVKEHSTIFYGKFDVTEKLGSIKAAGHYESTFAPRLPFEEFATYVETLKAKNLVKQKQQVNSFNRRKNKSKQQQCMQPAPILARTKKIKKTSTNSSNNQ